MRHLERIDWSPSPSRPPDTTKWPYTIPAVAQIISDRGMEIADGITFLVGENGSGKSTLIEAFAAVYPRTGFASNKVNVTGPDASDEDSELRFNLRARTNRRASPAGFFLRAEAMHAYLSEVDRAPRTRAWKEERLQTQSHGESFLAVLRHRFVDLGVYFLDEPEAALSFRSCLGLVSLLDTMRREGSQVIVATHSPVLTSLPGATLLELGEHGIRKVDRWEDLELVKSWRHFMDRPGQFLQHLVEP